MSIDPEANAISGTGWNKAPDVGDMDWSGQGRDAPVDCRVVLVVDGPARSGLLSQRPVIEAAMQSGFDVEGFAIKRAQTASAYHHSHMTDAAASADTKPLSGIEMMLRYPGPLPEASSATERFIEALPHDVTLVQVSIGRGGDDYHARDVVVIH